MNRLCQMKPNSDFVTGSGPQSSYRRYSGTRSASTIFGFSVNANQFQALHSDQSVVSPRSIEQRAEGLVDPRTTRRQRWTTRGTDDKEAKTEGAVFATVHYSNAQRNSVSENSVNPVAIDHSSQFFNSFSASPSDNFAVQSVGHVHYELDSGVVGGDSLYGDFKCNKRISNAGPDWSAGRPGHTPTRREIACVKHVEDSCAGPDWSAGRPGTMPFGARTAACLSPQTACIGPYGTAALQQRNTGHNTREESLVASTTSPPAGLPRPYITSQPTASTSGGHAADDRASPAKVALHPRRPPYFSGGLDEDVHVWTSIVDRWLNASQGEPSQQMTFVVSLLRGAAYDWYRHYETRTGCPGDWTTLRRAMLERFGTSIRAEKARAGIYRLRQGNMTVLQYADAFESYLAHN